MKMKYKIVNGEVVYRIFEDFSKKKWGTDNPHPLLKELKKPDGYEVKEDK